MCLLAGILILNQSGFCRSDPIRSGPIRSGPVRSGPVRSGPVRSDPGFANGQMAARWLPNTGEFFFSPARLIESSERQLHSASYDNSEFLIRRLDEYERTLATLLARFVESYGSLPSQQNTVSNLS